MGCCDCWSQLVFWKGSQESQESPGAVRRLHKVLEDRRRPQVQGDPGSSNEAPEEAAAVPKTTLFAWLLASEGLKIVLFAWFGGVGGS